MGSRAAVFSSEPQAVEVYQAGAWWAGELLGWRHLSDGSCQVQVRVVLGGVEETAWTDLAGLRLPERHLTVAPDSASGPATQELPRAAPPRRSRAARAGSDGDVAATASMPMMRDLSVVGTAPRPGGRRRAPDTGEMAAVTPVVVSRPGGRRRAPESGEMPAVDARPGGRRRAPETGEMVAAVSPTPRPSGRRRAPETGEMHTVVPGRHRTADTGLFPPVTESTAARGAVVAPEPDLLTRPMRLSDQAPHSRRPRLDGSLAGV
jgi:hypothetical protein